MAKIVKIPFETEAWKRKPGTETEWDREDVRGEAWINPDCVSDMAPQLSDEKKHASL